MPEGEFMSNRCLGLLVAMLTIITLVAGVLAVSGLCLSTFFLAWLATL